MIQSDIAICDIVIQSDIVICVLGTEEKVCFSLSTMFCEIL